MCSDGLDSEAEAILVNNNANEDDSDPDEGFMSTMSDRDIQNAIREMKAAYRKMNPENVQDMINALNSGTQDVSVDYREGFLDACKMIAMEYGISLEI